MSDPKYCPRCGCYIPEAFDSCPACRQSPGVVPKYTKTGLIALKNGGYSGFSWQEKPTGVPTGTAFVEVDTGDVYLYLSSKAMWIRA